MLVCASSAAAQAGEITEYPIPVVTTPYGVAPGPDGKVWIVDSGGHVGGASIGRMATNGAISEADVVKLPSPSLAEAATLGPDGNMWVAQDHQIDKVPVGVTATSQMTTYELGSGNKGFGSITPGPDGRLWFGWGLQVGAITTSGTVEGYATNSTSSIAGVTAGSDGKMWFSESGNTIARMDTSGKIGPGDEFTSPSSNIQDLALGSDGNIWFTSASPAAVNRITPAGVITTFPTPSAASLPFGIEAGPDNHMWFVEENANKIGSIPTSATSSAEIIEYPIPSKSAGAIYITRGPDSRMWFGESGNNALGAITTNLTPVTPISPVTSPTTTTTTTTAQSTPQSTTPLLALPHVPAPVGCLANKLILTDVYPQAGRVQVLGVAPSSAVGKRVAIVSKWNGKILAQASVQADLSFKATVALPPPPLRFTNRALYQAKLGSVRSGALKFARRMYTTAITAAGRTITFAGSVTPPLARKSLPVTIRASASCSGIANGTVVASAKLSRSGTYSTAVRLPASLQGAPAVYLQAETRVPQNARSKKTFPTFTLVRGVRLRP